MKKITKALIYGLIIGVLAYAAAIILLVFLSYDGEFTAEAFGNVISLVALFAGFFCGLIIPFTKKSDSKVSAPTKGKTSAGKEFDLHYDSHFMTDSELYSNKFLINTNWKSLPALKNTGLVIRNHMKNGRYEITMKDEVHSLVIGTTGSGKTSIIIDPTIRILAHTAEKPCIVVTDPKGELYERHAAVLKKEGYKVEVYDLDNPFVSSRWNPMERAFKLYHRAMKISSEAKKYSNCTPEAVGKKKIEGYEYGDSWYEFNGVAFPNEQMLRTELGSVKQQLINEATFDLRGIAAAVCPVDPQTQDKTWEQGAQDFLYGIMLAMLEDSLDERLGENKLRLDQFNFYNLYKIANKRDDDPDNPFGSLKRYCSGRLKLSDVNQLTSPVINNASNTTRSYMGVLAGKISSLMQDMGICYVTSGCDLDFKNFVDQPTAFFIKIPDHKKERHPLATICIAQLYRSLVDIANEYPNKKLPRHVYYLLDEFGNLPSIPDFATMVTVSRSRNIFFEIVIQSYTQLDTKYGRDISETLKGNFNAQIFLGTEDQTTKDAFSKACGEIQLIHEEKQSSKSKGDKDSGGSSSTSTSIQRTSRPLVDSFELGQLPFGTAIIKLFRSPPLKVKLDQFHKTTVFEKLLTDKTFSVSKSLNEQRVFFDIEKRNLKIFGRPNRWGDF